MDLEEKEKLKKEMKKEIQLVRMLARYTDIPQNEAVDIVLWTDMRNITQEVIDFVEEKLNRGETVEAKDLMYYIDEVITAMDKEQQNQY